MTDYAELRRQLDKRAASLINQYAPGGRWHAENHYQCASIGGGKGQSFSIQYGEKGWIWTDFAEGTQGDMIDFAKYHNVTMEIKTKNDSFGQGFKKPEVDWEQGVGEGAVINWFANRGLDNKELLSSLPIGRYIPGKEIVYEHCEDEKLTFAVYKGVAKKSSRCSPGCKQILWNMGFSLEDDQLTEKQIIITEGHEDAIAWMHAGCNAVSVPMGASNLAWLTHCYDYLKSMDQIFLCFDNDEPGHKLTETCIKRLGFGKCYILDLGKYKDSNDAYKDGGNDALFKIFSGAKECKPKSATKAVELVGDIKKFWSEKREDVGIPLLGDMRYGFRLRPSESTLVTGAEGAGKSNFLYQTVAHLLSIGKRVAVFSLEEDGPVIASLVYGHCMNKPCISSNEEHFNRVVEETKDRFFVHNHRGLLKIEELWEAIHYYISKHGVEFIVLDSLMKTTLDIEDNKETNAFMGELHKVIAESECHFFIVAHSRKSMDSYRLHPPGPHDIKGAQSISGMAFNIFCIWRNELKADMYIKALMEKDHDKAESIKNNMKDNLFKMLKQKVGGKKKQVDLFYNSESYHFSTDKNKGDPYIK